MKIHKVMILLVMTLQVFLEDVQGQIVCSDNGAGNPPDVAGVCDKTSNTFLCDNNADACSGEAFTGVKGTTSKCVGTNPVSDVCSSTAVRFDATETNEQGMTCEGEKACAASTFIFGDNTKRGTLTCKGGTVKNPACWGGTIFADCLVCDGPFSCYALCFFQGRPSGNPLPQCLSNTFFQGTLGVNCPTDKKATKPAFSCFSSSNIVEVKDKGLITMDSLKVGDFVKTGITEDGHSHFSRLMSLMHQDAHAVVEYHQIFMKDTPEEPLEISSDHFLFLNNKKVVRAKDVQVGDILEGDSAHMSVTHIHKIQRQGLYAPVTENGRIWVSGVFASSYISLLDNEMVSPTKQVMASHVALAPLRMVCNIGSFSICKDEKHSNEGYSTNLLTLIKFGLLFLSFELAMQLLLLIVSVPVLIVLAGLEMAMNHGIMVSVMAGGLFIIMSKTNKIVK